MEISIEKAIWNWKDSRNPIIIVASTIQDIVRGIPKLMEIQAKTSASVLWIFSRTLNFWKEIGLDCSCKDWLNSNEGTHYLDMCKQLCLNTDINQEKSQKILQSLFKDYQQIVQKSHWETPEIVAWDYLEHMRDMSGHITKSRWERLIEQIYYELYTEESIMIGNDSIKKLHKFIERMEQYKENAFIDPYKQKTNHNS